MRITADIIETGVGGRTRVKTFLRENERTLKKGDLDLDVKYMTCAALFLEVVVSDMTSDKEEQKRFLKSIYEVTRESLDEDKKRVVYISREGDK